MLIHPFMLHCTMMLICEYHRNHPYTLYLKNNLLSGKNPLRDLSGNPHMLYHPNHKLIADLYYLQTLGRIIMCYRYRHLRMHTLCFYPIPMAMRLCSLHHTSLLSQARLKWIYSHRLAFYLWLSWISFQRLFSTNAMILVSHLDLIEGVLWMSLCS